MRPAAVSACLSLSLLSITLSHAAEPAPAPPPEEPRKLSWGLSAEARFRPEWRQDADLDHRVDDDRRFGLMRLRLGLLLGYGPWKIFAQAQDARVAGEEASTVANEQNLDLHQGWVEISKLAGDRLALTIGRQEWKYGDERMIGAFGWDNIGRSFDGVRGRVSGKRWFLDTLAARVTSVPRTEELSQPVAGPTTGSDLYGVYGHITPRQTSEYEPYALVFDDNVRFGGETGTLGESLVNALGGRVKERWGHVDMTVEAAWETGEWRGDDLTAAAAAGVVGWTLGDPWKLRFYAGYDFATGDEDPADGEREEFFNFFPTNHPHYGYADYEGWRNLRSPHGGVSWNSGRHFVLGAYHRFLLEEEAGPWKDAAGNVLGFDPTGSSGTHVGGEWDLLYRLALMETAGLESGISLFQPGRFARRTRGDDPSCWASVMLTVSFKS
jgi:hypothetical protein